MFFSHLFSNNAECISFENLSRYNRKFIYPHHAPILMATNTMYTLSRKGKRFDAL